MANIRDRINQVFSLITGYSSNNTMERTVSSEIPEDNGYIWSGHAIPEEVIITIFSGVPARQLIRSSLLVCKYWLHLLTQNRFWFLKLEVEGIKLSNSAKKKLLEVTEDRKVLQILQGICTGDLPFNTNLILNPSGKDRFQHWYVRHGGNSLKVECPPVGSDEIPEEAGLPTQHCFVTSYSVCTRKQMISLQERGIPSWVINAIKPEIHITEWVSARFDCNSQSNTVVRLEGNGWNQEVKLEWSSSDEDVMCRQWYKLQRVVVDYPDGLSKITFTNCGKDDQFWAGHYGAKTAGSSVVLVV